MLSYLMKIGKLSEEIEKSKIIADVELIKDPTTAQPVAIRIAFSEPILLMLSHPICRMHARIPYPIEFKMEQFYVTRLGILPVYFVDLNTITLIKFWGGAARWVSSNTIKSFIETGTISMELRPSIRKTEYSSMNFIITFGGKLWKMSTKLDEYMRNYLKYTFWIGPTQGFSFSTHLLHSKAFIHHALKVAKTLCLIDEIKERTMINVMDRCIEGFKTRIRMLIERDGSFHFLRVHAIIPEDVLSQLRTAEKCNKISIEKSFLNAILLEIRSKKTKYELLSVVSDIGASSFELAQTLIAYQLMCFYNSKDNIARICSIDELRSSLNKMLKQVSGYVKLPTTFSDKFSIVQIFDLALGSLYPMFVLYNGNIYYLHPLVFSYLYSDGYTSLLSSKTKEKELGKLLELLEKIQRGSYTYFDEALEMFREASKSLILINLGKIVNRIKLSKVFRKAFSS